MNRIVNGTFQMIAVGLFALTGVAAVSPMTKFVDCSDEFWRVVCEVTFEPTDEADFMPGDEPDVFVGEPIRIDSDPVCAELDGGYIVCHT